MSKTLFRSVICIIIMLTGIGTIPGILLFMLWQAEDQNDALEAARKGVK